MEFLVRRLLITSMCFNHCIVFIDGCFSHVIVMTIVCVLYRISYWQINKIQIQIQVDYYQWLKFTEDAAIQFSTSSTSLSFIAPSVISPVPHLQKCSPKTKDTDTAWQISNSRTVSQHKYNLAENSDKERKKCMLKMGQWKWT
jgi:hypothetical protein